nr:retrovirus-related Pol polyprotein from transposon TNT 1-94 [Tanacetum cinerariifolium]
MKMEYWITNNDMNIWKVIQHGNIMKRTGRDRDGRVIILPPTTAEEHIAVQRESKARTTLLQSYPDDHVADFHYMDDARDIWNAVKARFGGNAESKKMRKSMLKQEFLAFRISKAEGLHKGYDRMQKILSQLNQLKAKPEDKDINLKFLRALPLSWSQVALTLKTKGRLELLSFDDLYYKLKTLEVDVKGYTTFSLSQSAGPSHSTFVSTTSVSKMMSYGDSPSYSSNTTYSVSSNSNTRSHKSSNVLKDVLQSFVTDTKPEQQLAYKDFKQIEKLDLEEMDLKWQMAMLSVRVHKFEQKAGRKIDFDKKESARFNKKKVRCYKCQQRGHSARECRAKGGNDKHRFSSFKIKEIGKKEEDSKALITVDTLVDWTDHDDEGDEVITAKEFGMIAGCDSEDAIKEGAAKIYNLITGTDTEEATTAGEAREFALMGVTSEVHSCPFVCDNKYNDVYKKYNELNAQNGEYFIQVQAYKNSLKTLEKQKRVLQQNQLTLKEKIRVLSIELDNTSNLLKHSKRINDEVENAKKDLQTKLDNHLVQTKKWRNSSKILFRLIDSSMSVRTKVGLGFNNYIRDTELGWDDSAFSVFTTNSKDVEGRPIFYSDKSLEVHTNHFAFSDSGVKSLEHKPTDSTSCASTSSVSTSVNEAEIESNVRTPIKEPIIVHNLPSFTCDSSNKNEHTSRTFCNKNGYFNKKACHFRKHASSVSKLCFVCGTGTHLIKDCDFYDKQMANTTVGIGVGSPVRPQPVPTSKPKVKLVPTGKPKVKPVLTGKPKVTPVPIGKPKVTPIPTGKPQVSTSVPTGRTNRPFPVLTNKGYSPSVISGWWSHTTSPMPHLITLTSSYFQTYTPYVSTMYSHHMKNGRDIWATVVKPLAGCSWKAHRQGNSFLATKDEGIFDSGCSRSMTGNKERLDNFQAFYGGKVTFGGGEGRITRKRTIRTPTLDFEIVYYVKELQQFNLLSISQICDKKNQVLFTDTECLVLFEDFKLLDNSMVVLKVPRKHNIYTIKLNDLCPRGKQHKALYKAISGVSSISEPLQLLHVDLFGPTSLRSIDHKYYCLVITDDYIRKPVEQKGIKREYSNPRTPQQNEVVERKNRTLIEAARTMLADYKLPTMFWTEAVRTACYVLNRVSVTSPHNKTPYALLTRNIPSISHFKPFGCHVTILNRSDHLGKFDGKADEGYIVGYSASNKAYRVYNVPNKRVEESMNLQFLEEKPNVHGLGHEWYFDLDYLTDSLGYKHVTANQPAGTQGATTNSVVIQADDLDSDCDEQVIIFPSYPSHSIQGTQPIDTPGDKTPPSSTPVPPGCIPVPTGKVLVPIGNLPVLAGNILVPAASTMVLSDDVPVCTSSSTDLMVDGEHTSRYPYLSDLGNHNPSPGIFSSSSYDDEFDTAVNNVASSIEVSPVETKRINTIHPQSLIIRDPTFVVQTRSKVKQNTTGDSAFISYIFDQQRNNHTDLQHYLFACFISQVEPRSVAQALEDPSWVDAMQEEMQQFKFQNIRVFVYFRAGKYAIGTKQEEGIDYDEVFALVARIEAIRLFLAFASYMGFLVYQMDVKNAFLYGKIDEEVYVTQPKGFVDPQHPKKVYKAYPKESPLVLEAYSDSDYAGSNKDRKSTTGGCHFLGRRLISWQCKKQTIMATSSTKVEYVAAANCYGQPDDSSRWISTFQMINMDQFWSTATLRAPELGPPATLATIDKTPYNITEELVRSRLQLADDGGIADLPILKIYYEMDNLGYVTEGKLTFLKNKFSPQWRFLVHTILYCLSTKSRSLDQFGSPIAIALIRLSNGRHFNLSNYIFKGMFSNIGNAKKFLMPQTSNPVAPALEHDHRSDPHETTTGSFPTREDAPLGGDLRTSPSRSSQAPLAGQPLGGKEDPITLTSLSSIVTTLMHKVHLLEAELHDHKRLFKDVVGKLVKKVKTLKVKLKTKKRKMVVIAVDLDIPSGSTSQIPAASPCAHPAVPPGASDVPPGASDVPPGASDVPAAALAVPAGSLNVLPVVTSSRAPAGVSSKGKSPMVEEDIPVKARTFKKMEEDRLGEDASKRLHGEEMAQMEKEITKAQRKRQQEVLDSAMYYNESDWLNIRAQVEANAYLSKTLDCSSFVLASTIIVECYPMV